uniref:Uncharacterized protein n=1 Tax=Candidatus Kentrum sp. SD TaxID=2126332 RepID=A0A450YPR8_9GAMM|nr:MAG: hypothetical protein BECKSD772F_GA0070984_11484 [Candidatus Kentron sp. SD]VFK80775.1 MAG: hypothetical protein BECKSD772D_GA0070982_11552 [Candidatus Kentron sp. SD]
MEWLLEAQRRAEDLGRGISFNSLGRSFAQGVGANRMRYIFHSLRVATKRTRRELSDRVRRRHDERPGYVTPVSGCKEAGYTARVDEKTCHLDRRKQKISRAAKNDTL